MGPYPRSCKNGHFLNHFCFHFCTKFETPQLIHIPRQHISVCSCSIHSPSTLLPHMLYNNCYPCFTSMMTTTTSPITGSSLKAGLETCLSWAISMFFYLFSFFFTNSLFKTRIDDDDDERPPQRICQLLSTTKVPTTSPQCLPPLKHPPLHLDMSHYPKWMSQVITETAVAAAGSRDSRHVMS